MARPRRLDADELLELFRGRWADRTWEVRQRALHDIGLRRTKHPAAIDTTVFENVVKTLMEAQIASDAESGKLRFERELEVRANAAVDAIGARLARSTVLGGKPGISTLEALQIIDDAAVGKFADAISRSGVTEPRSREVILRLIEFARTSPSLQEAVARTGRACRLSTAGVRQALLRATNALAERPGGVSTLPVLYFLWALTNRDLYHYARYILAIEPGAHPGSYGHPRSDASGLPPDIVLGAILALLALVVAAAVWMLSSWDDDARSSEIADEDTPMARTRSDGDEVRADDSAQPRPSRRASEEPARRWDEMPSEATQRIDLPALIRRYHAEIDEERMDGFEKNADSILAAAKGVALPFAQARMERAAVTAAKLRRVWQAVFSGTRPNGAPFEFRAVLTPKDRNNFAAATVFELRSEQDLLDTCPTFYSKLEVFLVGDRSSVLGTVGMQGRSFAQKLSDSLWLSAYFKNQNSSSGGYGNDAPFPGYCIEGPSAPLTCFSGLNLVPDALTFVPETRQGDAMLSIALPRAGDSAYVLRRARLSLPGTFVETGLGNWSALVEGTLSGTGVTGTWYSDCTMGFFGAGVRPDADEQVWRGRWELTAGAETP